MNSFISLLFIVNKIKHAIKSSVDCHLGYYFGICDGGDGIITRNGITSIFKVWWNQRLANISLLVEN